VQLINKNNNDEFDKTSSDIMQSFVKMNDLKTPISKRKLNNQTYDKIIK